MSGVNVGSIFSEYLIDISPFEAGMKKVRSTLSANDQAFAESAAKGANALNGTDASTKKLVHTLEGMKSKLSSLKSEFEKVEVGSQRFKQLQSEIKKTESEIEKAQRGMKGFGGSLGGLGEALKAVGIVATAGSILKMGADMEQTAVSFETLLGSAEKAKTVLSQLNDFANVTPYTNEEVIKAGRSLLAFGVEAEKIPATLNRIGDVAAGLNIPFGELAEIYGKMRVQGRLQMEDINQLQGRGIPIVTELAKSYHVSGEQIRKMVEDGKIGFADMDKVLTRMTSQGGMFFGMMDKQSRTAAGLWSTFTGTMENTAGKVGLAWLETLKPILAMLVNIADGLNQIVDAVGGFLKAHPIIAEFAKDAVLAATAVGAWSLAMSVMSNSMIAQFIPGLAKLTAAIQANAAGIARAAIPLAAFVAGYMAVNAILEGNAEAQHDAGVEAQRGATKQVESVNAIAKTYKELGDKTNRTADEQQKFKTAQEQLNKIAKEHGMTIRSQNMSYEEQMRVIKKLREQEIRALMKDTNDLVEKIEKANSTKLNTFLSNLSGENARLTGEMEELERRRQAIEEENKKDEKSNQNTAGQFKAQVVFDKNQVMQNLMQATRFNKDLEINLKMLENDSSRDALKRLKELQEKGIIDLEIKPEVIDTNEYKKIEQLLSNNAPRNNIKLNVQTSAEPILYPSNADRLSEALSAGAKDGTVVSNYKIKVNPETIKSEDYLELKNLMDMIQKDKNALVVQTDVKIEDKADDKGGIISKMKARQQKLIEDLDNGALSGFAKLEARVAKFNQKLDENVQEVAQFMTQAISTYQNVISSIVANKQEALKQSYEKQSWMLDIFSQKALQVLQKEIDDFKRAEEEKVQAAKDAMDMRIAMLDEEFQAKKEAIEREYALKKEQDARDRDAKKAQLEKESADRTQALYADDLIDQDFKDLMVLRDQQMQDAIAAAAADANGKKETEKKQSETNIQKIQKDSNDKITKLEQEKADKEKLIKKGQALVRWQFESATLQLSKRIQSVQAMTQGVQAAAATFGAIMSSISMIPIVGPFMALPMALGASTAIMGQTVNAVRLINSQVVLPPAELFLADGGVVRGPGGPRADMIPANISDGEAIVDATRTRKMLEFIDSGARSKGISIVIHPGAFQGVGEMDERKMNILSRLMAQRVERYL